METLKQSLVFSLKKPFFIIYETETSKKVLYISGNRTFFIFQERFFHNPAYWIFLIFQETEPSSNLIFPFKYSRKRKNFFLTCTFPYKEAKFSKLKCFLIIKLKRFFSLSQCVSFYSQPVYLLHLVRDFCNVLDHIVVLDHIIREI